MTCAVSSRTALGRRVASPALDPSPCPPTALGPNMAPINDRPIPPQLHAPDPCSFAGGDDELLVATPPEVVETFGGGTGDTDTLAVVGADTGIAVGIGGGTVAAGAGTGAGAGGRGRADIHAGGSTTVVLVLLELPRRVGDRDGLEVEPAEAGGPGLLALLLVVVVLLLLPLPRRRATLVEPSGGVTLGGIVSEGLRSAVGDRLGRRVAGGGGGGDTEYPTGAESS